MPFTMDSDSAKKVPGRVSIPSSADLRANQDRLDTFRNWPREFITPDELASNGFFYTGYEDLVQCAFCGIGIMRWADGERAEDHHGKASPVCGFVRAKATGNITQALPPLRAPTAAPEVNGDPENLVILLRNLGINVALGPRWPDNATFAYRLTTFVFLNSDAVVPPLYLAEAGFFAVERYRTLCFYCGGCISDWQVNDDPWVRHARSFPLCAFVNLMKGRDFVDRAGESGASALPPPADKTSLDEKSGKTKKESPTPKVIPGQESKICVICMDEKRTIVFLPCCHLVTCPTCASSVLVCPICRQPFSGTISVNC